MPASAADAVAPQKKRRPARLITSISVALLVALLLGVSGYALYNVFAAHDESAAARVLPGNTLAYASIDIVQYAKNSHSFSVLDLFSSAGQAQNNPLKQATGLDWQTDILPWVDRDIAVASFPRPAPDVNASGLLSAVGGAILLQSKDTTAAQHAMKKAADFQSSQGRTISQSSYSGFILYAQNSGNGTTFTSGSGWAIIATDAAAAHIIIDRINGKGDTLADSTSYQNATSNLASDRFGTTFVNIDEIYAIVAERAGSSANQMLPFAAIYPTAGGFFEWTSAGLRTQVTLRAAKNLAIGDLHGDTTSLASLAPRDATLYAGVGNLGADSAAVAKIRDAIGNSGATGDPLKQLLGVSSDNPVLQQPAAVVESGGSVNAATPGVAFLLKAPDPEAAENLLRQVASAHHLTVKTMTIDGQNALELYSTGSSSPDVATIVNGTLVVGSSPAMVTAIINTAAGGQSLAKQSDFQKLAQNSPSDAASTLFVNLTSLQPELARLGQDGGIGKLLAHTTALLLTNSVNDQESQTTLDLTVHI